MALNNFGRNMKALRERYELTQTQLADSLGVTQNTVAGWETREKMPRSKEVFEKIRQLYKVTDQDLYGFSDGLYAKMHGLTNTREAVASESYAPVVGIIAAGDPREAYEMADEKLWIPPEILERDPDAFYLLVGSDSMDETEFSEGVYAAISPNTPVKSGDIAAVKVNGDEATLKIVKFYDDFVALEPRSSNPDYKRIIIDKTDPDAPYFKILGKAIWPYRPIKF